MRTLKNFKEVPLKNGAVLRYAKNNLNKITTTEIMFNCGSRVEEIFGLAHFTEHMFFTGTKSLNKEEVTKKYFDFIGSNAHTTYKNICFTGKVFTKEFEQYIQTVEMLINQSTFAQSAVDKEIKVVQQEIASCKDNFRRKAGEFHDYNFYQMETFKNSILGTAESVASIKSKDVKNFVNKYFVAENTEIFVVSPLSLSKVKAIVENSLVSKLATNSNFEKLPKFLQPAPYKFFNKIKKEAIDKCYIFLNFTSDRNYYDIEFNQKFSIVLKMLNDASEGIMKDMRYKKSLVYGGGFYDAYHETGSYICFETECDKENVNEVIITLAEYLNNIKAVGFEEALLKKVKRKYDYNEDAQEPRIHEKIGALYTLKYLGKVYRKKDLNKLSINTTLTEANEMFNEIFKNPKLSISIYGNVDKKLFLSDNKIKELFQIK